VKDDQTNASVDVPVDSIVLYGPLQADPGREIRADDLEIVLADDQSGVQWRMFAADEPDVEGLVVKSGFVGPGRNGRVSSRVKGANVWVELRNARSERWALEGDLNVGVALGGRTRSRR
jgi:hypothetical protein